MLCSSKGLSYGVIFFLNFLTGVEYGVILPTALQYLKKYGGNQVELGFCVAAYSFSSLFSSPLMGFWSDRTSNLKLILLVSNLFQIGGSFMYFMGISTYFIIGGRLVAGIGLGCLSSAFSEIIKNTSVEERSPILSRIMVGRQVGMIIGPAFNFLFLNMSVELGPFLLDNLSAPGLLMTAAWTLLQIFIVFFFKNLNEFSDPTQNSVDETASLITNRANTVNYDSVNDTQTLDAERPANRINLVDNLESGSFWLRLYEQYMREEVVAVYAACFIVFFMQTTLETFLTPFTKDYFNWGPTENSILYAVCGIEIMVIFVVLSFVSKKVSDRLQMLIGTVINLLTLIYLIVYLPRVTKNNIGYVEFLVPCFFNVFSLPLIVLSSISLLSKVTSLESQGMTQGIRRSLVGIANILGPLWSGSYYGMWYVLLGVLIGLMTMTLIMTILSFKYLKSSTDQQKNKANEIEE